MITFGVLEHTPNSDAGWEWDCIGPGIEGVDKKRERTHDTLGGIAWEKIDGVTDMRPTNSAVIGKL